MNPSERPRVPEPCLPFPVEGEQSDDDCNNGASGPPSAGDYWNWCPNCGARLVDHRCKRRCPRCSYYMSCSDFD